ncbi:MAG: hypothetical protein PUP91_16790 [Rhizonema sp. PD37]|nr:hypothetical protein [Rhizonema sp. PD37]
MTKQSNSANPSSSVPRSLADRFELGNALRTKVPLSVRMTSLTELLLTLL